MSSVPDTIQVGDAVTFQQQYGSGYLKAVGDELHVVYRRRTRRGIVRHILSDTALIEVEGASQYQGLVGVPLEKVSKR